LIYWLPINDCGIFMMICRVWGSLGDGYEELHLLWFNACSPLEVTRRYGGIVICIFKLDLFFDPEDGSDLLLQNVGWLSKNYTALFLRRQNSSLRWLLSILYLSILLHV
jgi:hypothetical protein